MATTANGLPYPIGTDLVVNGDDAIKALAEALDTTLLTAYSTWVPTFTGYTQGNGSVGARYHKVGKRVHAYLAIALNSTSAVTGQWTISLPFAMNASMNSQGMPMGVGVAFIATTFYPLMITPASNSTVLMRSQAGVPVAPTIPATWASGSTLGLSITYEAA